MSKNFELMQNLGKEAEVLGSVPANPVPVPAPASAPSSPAAVAAAPAIIPAPAPEKPGMEQIAGLVHQLFLAPGTQAPRSVVFVSTEPGNGCTWVCSHTAEMLASRVAASVCVVDANLRDPGLHKQFEVENARGFSEALMGSDPIRGFARNLYAPNLWLISAGGACQDAQPLLASDRVRLRIAELRAEFDFVLIDSCAMTLGHDAINLGANSDGVLVVLRANTSRKETAKQMVEDLQGSNAKVLGAVLNQRSYPIPEAIYKRL